MIVCVCLCNGVHMDVCVYSSIYIWIHRHICVACIYILISVYGFILFDIIHSCIILLLINLVLFKIYYYEIINMILYYYD